MPLAALVHATSVSESFLSKVLQRLVHTGMVTSHRGTGGGFCLKELPEKITLLDVIESIEGPLELNVCLGSGQGCDREGWCGTHSVWHQAQERSETGCVEPPSRSSQERRREICVCWKALQQIRVNVW